jgi:hypothetical protein
MSEEWIKLYHAINDMMCTLGAEGEISTRESEVEAVMDALHEIDGGVYDPNLKPEPPGDSDDR